jgi:hypothetical protein
MRGGEKLARIEARTSMRGVHGGGYRGLNTSQAAVKPPERTTAAHTLNPTTTAVPHAVNPLDGARTPPKGLPIGSSRS